MILNLQNNRKIPTFNINLHSLAILYVRVLQYSLQYSKTLNDFHGHIFLLEDIFHDIVLGRA